VQSTSEIDLSWNAVAGSPQYTVYRINPGTWMLTELGTTYGTTWVDGNGLSAGETYRYVVQYGDPTTAAAGQATTDSTPGTLSPITPGGSTQPTNLTATGVNDLEIFLQWTNNAVGETGTIIQIWDNTLNQWDEIGQVDPGVDTFLARDRDGLPTDFMSEDTAYQFRIESVVQDSSGDDVAESAWSSTATGYVVAPWEGNPNLTDFDTIMIVGGKGQSESWLEAGNGVGAEWLWLVNHGMNAFLSADSNTDGVPGTDDAGVVEPNGRGEFYDEMVHETFIDAANIGFIGYGQGGGIVTSMSAELAYETVYNVASTIFDAFAAFIPAEGLVEEGIKSIVEGWLAYEDIMPDVMQLTRVVATETIDSEGPIANPVTGQMMALSSHPLSGSPGIFWPASIWDATDPIDNNFYETVSAGGGRAMNAGTYEGLTNTQEVGDTHATIDGDSRVQNAVEQDMYYAMPELDSPY